MKKIISLVQRIQVGIFAVCVLFSVGSCSWASDSVDTPSKNTVPETPISKKPIPVPEKPQIPDEDPFDYDKGFITSWKIDGKELVIPIDENYNYDYNLFWINENDPKIRGEKLNITNQKKSNIDLPESGIYIVKISGTFPAIYFFPNPIVDMKGKSLLEIKQWGNIKWKSMKYAFRGCESLRISAKDAPDLSGVESMKGMFLGAKSFNDPLDNWDVSHIKDMSEMFHNARSFNQPLDRWDVGNVKDMNIMFFNATSFNRPLNGWNVSNVVNMNGMFLSSKKFNQPLDKWDVSNVKDMGGMFNGAEVFNQNLNPWKLRADVFTNGMFEGSAMKKSNYNSNSWKDKVTW